MRSPTLHGSNQGEGKNRVDQLKASVFVNHELMCLYWQIGSVIIERQMNSGWGSKVIDRLTNDLRAACPTMKGISLTNVKYMVQFAKEYPDFLISQAVFGQITWSHNIVLLQKLNSKRASKQSAYNRRDRSLVRRDWQ